MCGTVKGSTSQYDGTEQQVQYSTLQAVMVELRGVVQNGALASR